MVMKGSTNVKGSPKIKGRTWKHSLEEVRKAADEASRTEGGTVQLGDWLVSPAFPRVKKPKRKYPKKVSGRFSIAEIQAKALDEED